MRDDEKECKRCHGIKTKDQFWKSLAMADGLQYWCRQCMKEHRQLRAARRRAAREEAKEQA